MPLNVFLQTMFTRFSPTFGCQCFNNENHASSFFRLGKLAAELKKIFEKGLQKKHDPKRMVSVNIEPMRYINAKIMSLGFRYRKNPNRSFLWNSEVSYVDGANVWFTEVCRAPVGSILRLPEHVKTEATDINVYCQTHFVKTTHFAFILDLYNEGMEADTNVYNAIHGNSGVGKTSSLDIICRLASAQGVFVVRTFKERYADMWSAAEVKSPGGWKLLLLKGIWKDNSNEVFRHYLGLPKHKPADTTELSKEQRANENMLTALDQIVTWKPGVAMFYEKEGLTAADVEEKTEGCYAKLLEELAKEGQEKGLMVIDDINTLSKGYTKREGQD